MPSVPSARSIVFELGQEVLVPHAAVKDPYSRLRRPSCAHSTHLVGRISGEPVYKGDSVAKILLASDYERSDPAVWVIEVNAAEIVGISPNDSRKRNRSKHSSGGGAVAHAAGLT